MKLLTLTSILLIGVIVNNAIRRSNVKSKKINEEFWEKERASRLTPKRSTEDLRFIAFPDDLPLHLSTDDLQIKEYQETLANITKNPVINLSGISNTDIRLAYGNSNMEELSRADERYIVLCRTLNSLASAYMREGFTDEAVRLLEFAISVGSDVRDTWISLGRIYLEKEDMHSLDRLISDAGTLDEKTAGKKEILDTLKDYRKLNSIIS